MGKSIPKIAVVIPCRKDESADVTLNSLLANTIFDQCSVLVLYDKEGRGAPWARNKGWEWIKANWPDPLPEFVLFSDADIAWKSNALETMIRVLEATPKASYVYGRYKLGNDTWSDQAWDPIMLKQKNYISTMSIIRTKDLPDPPFDESIKRLQDWDLWLTMLEQGKRGVYCGDLIFETPLKPGISHLGMNYIDAVLTVRKKHGLE